MASKGSSKHDLGLLFLRLGAGILMALHGFNKISTWSEKVASFPDPLHLGSQLSLSFAIGAEFFCSLLLILGIATRLVAIPLLFLTCVIVFVVLGGAELKVRELPMLYGIIFISLILLGGGGFSLGSKFPKLKKFN